MKKTLITIAILLIGINIGWFARSAIFAEEERIYENALREVVDVMIMIDELLEN